jgi:ABC-2 type transport system ATP-binding protein
MIMDILYPDSGVIRIFNNVQTGIHLDRIGYLPEERGLYKKMKTKELIRFYCELKRVTDPSREADHWLAKFDLAASANKKVEALSKGMSQKVQFIITVINKPDIIILDEPFSGLDPVNADIIKEAILELRKSGSTILFSTHDMAVAEKMCDFIFMIYKGEKVLDGTLESIRKKFGEDTIRIQTEAGMNGLRDIGGISNINDFGQVQEIRILPETDDMLILKEIMSRTRIKKFEISSPSLNDIFIRIAKPDKTNNHE